MHIILGYTSQRDMERIPEKKIAKCQKVNNIVKNKVLTHPQLLGTKNKIDYLGNDKGLRENQEIDQS